MGKHNKPDTSPRVQQNDKIKENLKIKPFKWTEKQHRFIDLALSKDIDIIICHGSPGTGKTLLSLYCCLELLNKKSIANIVFYRSPIESATKSLGFLSGDYNEKIAPYGEPLQDHLKELLDKNASDKLLSEKRISIDSIGFAKGRTHNATGVILDEAEDLTVQELELIMGRLGKFSKLFIIGDTRQSNIKNGGFKKVFDLFDDDESLKNGIATFTFASEDCMRNEILKFILEKFEKLE
jgi:phosphate starvation-inducible PhoH-like protein